MKRKLALLLAITLLASGIHWNNDAMAATKKVALSKKSVQLSEGKTMSMTLKNARKRVKWAIENKKIVQITKKSGARKNKIVIKGKKAGTTKITAKCGKKKYVVKVKVRAKKDIVQTTANNPKEATTAISETTTAEAVTTVIEETAKTAEETTNAVEDKTEVIGETTKDIETTIPEGTTEAIVEATTLSETTNGIMETTTIEEKTGAAVEMTTIAGETTTIIEETSNNSEQWSTEQETTKAPISDTEESVRIIGEVKNDKMTVDDDLYISYRIDGNEGAYAYYNEIGKLEIFEDDTWKQMERKEGAVIGEMGYMLFAGESSEYRVELQNWYKDIRPGHYRYTHKIGDMDVPVEFDIYTSGTKVVGIPKNDKIILGDDLYIRYYVVGNEGTYAYYRGVGKLEIYEDNEWVEMEKATLIDISGIMLYSGDYSEYRVELQNWYKDIRPGHYRYTHKIGDMDIPVEFDICGENHLETP